MIEVEDLELVMLTITHVMSWRGEAWAEHLPSRQAWFVTCPQHPKLGMAWGKRWGYLSLAIAHQVAAKHGNAKHSWPQHEQRWDLVEVEGDD